MKTNRNKYHAEKSNGYDSRKEKRRADELHLLLRQGIISNLQEQVRYEILARQTDETGKVLERAAYYTADFVYTDANGRLVVEDVKSPATRQRADYVLRRKLMLYQYGIRIVER